MIAKKVFLVLVMGVLSSLGITLCFAEVPTKLLRMASTTSTQNSGLFDALLPLFQKETGIAIQIIAVGTGAALRIGRNGDVDLVFVHAKEAELEMVRQGWFVDRRDVMYNSFLFVGPPKLRKQLSNSQTVTDFLQRVQVEKYSFLSRGDQSGTHKKELQLWRFAGISPTNTDWYLESGQGMAKTLRIASHKQLITLTDEGTFYALSDLDRLELIPLFEGDPQLFNQYGVMIVNPVKFPHIHFTMAQRFVDWIVSDNGQRAIASFKSEQGRQLFHPNANSH